MTKLTQRQRGYVEGFAAGLERMMMAVSADSPCGKSYDPMRIIGDEMHSYAFDLKDGGRHHHLGEYKNMEEICELLLTEALEWLRDSEVEVRHNLIGYDGKLALNYTAYMVSEMGDREE